MKIVSKAKKDEKCLCVWQIVSSCVLTLGLSGTFYWQISKKVSSVGTEINSNKREVIDKVEEKRKTIKQEIERNNEVQKEENKMIMWKLVTVLFVITLLLLLSIIYNSQKQNKEIVDAIAKLAKKQDIIDNIRTEIEPIQEDIGSIKKILSNILIRMNNSNPLSNQQIDDKKLEEEEPNSSTMNANQVQIGSNNRNRDIAIEENSSNDTGHLGKGLMKNNTILIKDNN